MEKDPVEVDEDGEVERPKKVIPQVQVIYCGVCGLPSEYCELGPTLDKCKQWMKTNNPDVYAVYKDAVSKFEKQKEEEKKEESASTQKQEGGAAQPGQVEEKQQEVKQKDTGQQKKADKQMILIQVNKRRSKQFITTITGLLAYNISLKDAAKKCRSKFACGCSATEDSIEIQGDIAEDLKEFIIKEYPQIKDDVFEIKEVN